MLVGKNLSRIVPVQAASQGTSWAQSGVAPGQGTTPGTGQHIEQPVVGIYVSEISDTAAGSGQYVYEFVELFVDGIL